MKKIIIALFFLLIIVSNLFAATAQFNVDAGDGVAGASSQVSYPGTANFTDGNGMYPQKSYPGTYNYTTIVACCKFDTSSLPDTAVVTSAYLYVNVIAKDNDESRSLYGEYYNFGTLSTSDFTADVGTTAFSSAISSINVGYGQTWNLSNVSNINKTGYTGFRFGISGDAPALGKRNSVTWAQNGGLGATVLYVTYTTGYAKKINGISNAPKINAVSMPTKVNGI